MLSALELAELSLELLYRRDAAGLLLATRASDPRDVKKPAFHLVRTVEGNRWLIAGALGIEERAHLEAALRAEPVVDDLAALEARPPLLAASAGVDLYRGPAFVVPDDVVSPNRDVEIVDLPRGLHTVPQLAWVREAESAAFPLCVARNAGGEVVAVCHSARSLATAAAAGVETAEDYRLRGLGTAVVAGWAAAVRAEGRLALYGTQWTNLASRAIARKLGLGIFAEDVHPA